MFRFENSSSYSYFFVFLLALLGLYVLRVVYSKYLLKREFSLRVSKYYWGNIGFWSFGLKKFIFFVLGSFFAILSLWRPQYGQKKVPVASEGVEVAIVLDISMSMAAEDVKPSRLKLAKIQLNKLFEKLQGNKIGLIAFAGQVGVISPLTHDTGALSLFLDSLDFETISEQGTNVKDALAEAHALLKRGSETKQKKSSQVVLLVTDGEDHSEDSIKEAKRLHIEGVRTYVIGVGSTSGGRIPIKDSFGQVVSYLHDKKGDLVLSKPNFTFLKSLAKTGQGSYYSLGVGVNVLDAIQKDLSRLKTQGFETTSFDVSDEYFQYPLTLSLIFYLLFFISSATSKAPRLRSLKYIENKD